MENMIIDQDDLIQFIHSKTDLDKSVVESVVNLEMDYLKEIEVVD